MSARLPALTPLSVSVAILIEPPFAASARNAALT